jgi:predicted TPR repeat methyltransferase
MTAGSATSSRTGLDAIVRDGLAYAMDERLAPYYERHLVEECRYRTPDVAAELMASIDARGLWVDLGAGTGLVGKAITRRAIGVELVALDISEAMLGLIDAPSYIERRQADATLEIPFGEGHFDGAVAAGLLEHVTRPVHLFRNVARVVKANGAFVFTFAPNNAGRTELFDAGDGLVSHDIGEVREGLASVGFSVAREMDVQAYLPGPEGWVTHRIVVGVRRAA